MSGEAIISIFILMILIITVCIGLCVHQSRTISSLKEDAQDLKEYYQSTSAQLQTDVCAKEQIIHAKEIKQAQLIESMQGMERRNIELTSRINELTERLGSLKDAGASEALQDHIAELEQRRQHMIEELQTLENTTADHRNNIQVLSKELESLHLQYDNDKAQLQASVDATLKELESLKQTASQAARQRWLDRKTKEEEDARWTFQLDGEEKRMVDLISKIAVDYPEIEGELNNILWKKIYLRKIQQDIVKRNGIKGGGIYRLVWNIPSDDAEEGRIEFGYVGQAKDIKERWYQHAKKILHMESVGNERLYKMLEGVRLEDIKWMVLEEGDGKEWLNSRERYWIEFFGEEANIR